MCDCERKDLSPAERGLIHRRDFLMQASAGLGSVALTAMLAEDGLLPQAFADGAAPDLLAPKTPHLAPRAKSVIWLFMEGGPSHLDTFDPKPLLQELAGKPMPASFGRPITAMGTASNALMPSQRTFKQYGQSGIPVSDWLPNVAEHADKLAVIRSCWADGLNHVGSVRQMNTGSVLAGRPSMGAWVTYGLGTSNRDLPTFVVLTDANEVVGGPPNWGSGFLPAAYQGTQFLNGPTAIFHLKPPETVGEEQQKAKIELLTRLNRRFSDSRADDSELLARLGSYELAYRMQTAAPEAVDLSQESEATRQLYGMDNPASAKFGANCLMARRLVERNVRFIQLYSGSGSGWDAHTEIERNHSKMCGSVDKPIAGLLADLEARGLLDTTLIVWGGEFGRTPFTEKGTGRDHNPWGFSIFMAGAGIKGGQIIGETDEIGFKAIQRQAHVHDIHATILQLLGLHHRETTYFHNGRDERPTINGGIPLREIVG